MLLGVFGCQHCPQGESSPRVGVMADGYAVGIRVVANRMDAGHFALPATIDQKTVVVHGREFMGCPIGTVIPPDLPSAFPVELPNNFLCRRDGPVCECGGLPPCLRRIVGIGS